MSIIISHEELTDRILEEFEEMEINPPTEESINNILIKLCDEEQYLIREEINDGDEIIYRARHGLRWNDFQDLSCPIEKQILLYLVENPSSFVVLLNTQRGKSAIVAKHMDEWVSNNLIPENTKIIPFLFVLNDRTLADQTEHALKHVSNKRVFQLSTNTKVNEKDIMQYIGAFYASPEDTPTPIIMSLPNKNQMAKVISILDYITDRAMRGTSITQYRGWNIKYAFIFDEFDQVYPQIRDKLLKYISNTQFLHRVGWISATTGDTDQYEECANAYFETQPEESPYYRGFHHEDSKIQKVLRAPHKRNSFVMHVLENNRDHFYDPVYTQNGEQIYRRIIVNSEVSRDKMETLAKTLIQNNQAYCITLNMLGLKLFRSDSPLLKFPMHGQRLNEVLYAIFKIYRLHDKPLFIIGGRKVDRGLGFHYAPRRNEYGEFETYEISLKLNKKETVVVISENGEGLIFTDEILGSIDNRDTAVQKAGRGAGVIAQCPQYCGSFHYWTNPHTANIILQHNEKVDYMNKLPGVYTFRQADFRGEEQISNTEDSSKFYVDPDKYTTSENARTEFNNNMYKTIDGNMYRAAKFNTYCYSTQNELVECSDLTLATHIKYRGSHRTIPTIQEFQESTDLGWGISSSARIMPVRHTDGIYWYIIYNKDIINPVPPLNI